MIEFVLFILTIVLMIRVIKQSTSNEKRKHKSFAIQVIILLGLLFYFAWTFRIIPYANNFYVQDRTEYLTGKKFWSQKEFIFESMSVRGESYVFEVYKFNDETSEFFEQSDSLFFAEFPPDNMTDIRWTRTPIEKSEKEILEFVLSFHNSQDKELMKWQNIIREEAYKSRSYYSYSQRVIRQKTYFYIIIPEMNYIGIIYLNT